jgi:hypothetical protein
MRRALAVAVAAFWLATASALAYVVKLKDGTLIFARTEYTVKGTKAIITLENGTVTQYDVDKIDVPGTLEYNEKYKGNVIALDTPNEKTLSTPQPTAPPLVRLQDLIRQRKLASTKPLPTPNNPLNPGESVGSTWGAVDRSTQDAFAKFFDGASISQYRLINYRGNLRLLSTANSEEAVFNTLGAAARAVADLSAKGHDVTLEIVLTTSGGETAGTFQMTPEHARLLVNGQITVADYFVKNVVL